MAVTLPANLPTPPLSVGQPEEDAPRVVQRQSGIRSRPVDPALQTVLETAAKAANVEVVVFSGGQAGKGEDGPRTGSTRHDHGMAADVYLYQNGRQLKFTSADDRSIISAFVSASIAGGATGVGAGIGYMGPAGVHVGFGPNGVKGGPVMTWGAGGASVNAPDWLITAASPVAVRTQVALVQSNLKALGYLDGEVDGILGDKTVAALNAFAAKNGGGSLKVAGMPGGYQAFLGKGPLLDIPPVESAVNTGTPVSLSRVAAVISGGGRLRKGDRSDAVRETQAFLNARGVTDSKGNPLTEDGVFGPRTKAALRAYQETHPELRSDAVVGPRTLAAMASDQTAAALARGREAENARLTAMAAAVAAKPVGTTAGNQVPETAVTSEAALNQALAESEMNRNAMFAAITGAGVATALMGYTPDFSIADPYVAGRITRSPIDTNNPIFKSFSPETQAFLVASDGKSIIDEHNSAVGLQKSLNEHVALFKSTALDLNALGLDNAFAVHDSVTDPLRLGGGGALGQTGAFSAPELDTLHGAIRSAASTIRASSTPGFGGGLAATPQFGNVFRSSDVQIGSEARVFDQSTPESGGLPGVTPNRGSGTGFGTTPQQGTPRTVTPSSGDGFGTTPQSGTPQSPRSTPSSSTSSSTATPGSGYNYNTPPPAPLGQGGIGHF